MTVTEGNGANNLQFGSGTVNATGGNGADIYTLVSGSSSGSGTISGFKLGTDLIRLAGFEASEAQNAIASETVAGGNTSFSFTSGEHLTLVGVTGVTNANFS